MSFLREIKLFALIFIVVTLGLVVFTNAKLFIADIEGSVLPTAKAEAPLTKETIYQDNSIASVIDINDQKDKQIQAMLDQYKKS